MVKIQVRKPIISSQVVDRTQYPKPGYIILHINKFQYIHQIRTITGLNAAIKNLKKYFPEAVIEYLGINGV